MLLSLAGTSWARYWEFIAMNAVLAVIYVLISAVPIGYSDGSMLFHLLTWTPHGQLLVDNNASAQIQDEARACFEDANFDKQVHLCENLLERSQHWGNKNALAIAVGQQQLGSAKAALGDWTGAEVAVSKMPGVRSRVRI
jgi:hypothetical protein